MGFYGGPGKSPGFKQNSYLLISTKGPTGWSCSTSASIPGSAWGTLAADYLRYQEMLRAMNIRDIRDPEGISGEYTMQEKPPGESFLTKTGESVRALFLFIPCTQGRWPKSKKSIKYMLYYI